MTVFTNLQTGVQWMYLTRSNFDEVSKKTGLNHAELEEIMTYQEEAGNHHAPVRIPHPTIRRARVLRGGMRALTPEPPVGENES